MILIAALALSSTSCKRESEADENRLMAGEFSARPVASIPQIFISIEGSPKGYVNKPGTTICSGVLIEQDAEFYLLTAAHCLFEDNLELKENLEVKINSGSDGTNTSPISIRDKNQVCYNQNYSPNNRDSVAYDFAIVKIPTTTRRHNEFSGFKLSTIQNLGSLLRDDKLSSPLIAKADGIGAGWGIDPETHESRFGFGAATVVTLSSETKAGSGLLSGKAIWIDGDSGGPFIVKKNETPYIDLLAAKNSGLDDDVNKWIRVNDLKRNLEQSYLNPEGSNKNNFAVIGIAVTYYDGSIESRRIKRTYLIDLGSRSSLALIANAMRPNLPETNNDSCFGNSRFGDNYNYEMGIALEELGEDIDGGAIPLVEIRDNQLSDVPYIGYIGNDENFCNISVIIKDGEHWLVTAKHCISNSNGTVLSDSVLSFCQNLTIKGRLEGKVACLENQDNKYDFRIFGEEDLENGDIIFIKARSEPRNSEFLSNSVINISDENIANIFFVSYSAGKSENEVKKLHGYLFNSSYPLYGTKPNSSDPAATDCQSEILVHGMFDFSQGSTCKISGGVNNAFYHPFNTEIGQSGGVVFTKLGEELKVVCVNIGRKDLFNYCINYELPPISVSTDPIEPPPPPPPPPPPDDPCMIAGAVAAPVGSKFTCTVTSCNLRTSPNKNASQPSPSSINSTNGEHEISACFNNTVDAERVWACIKRPNGVAWVFVGYSVTSCESYLE